MWLLQTELIDGEKHEHNVVSKINLVDLAGSERQDLAKTTGDRLRVSILHSYRIVCGYYGQISLYCSVRQFLARNWLVCLSLSASVLVSTICQNPVDGISLSFIWWCGLVDRWSNLVLKVAARSDVSTLEPHILWTAWNVTAKLEYFRVCSKFLTWRSLDQGRSC